VDLITWSPGVTIEAIEEQIIKKALAHYRGNKTVTAQSLGISVRTLDNKLEKYFEDQKKNQENADAEKLKRQEFLMRCRGQTVVRVPQGNPEMVIPVQPPIQEHHQPKDDFDGIQTTMLKKSRGK
jgi:Bacterial regulatory protein, Fis family